MPSPSVTNPKVGFPRRRGRAAAPPPGTPVAGVFVVAVLAAVVIVRIEIAEDLLVRAFGPERTLVLRPVGGSKASWADDGAVCGGLPVDELDGLDLNMAPASDAAFGVGHRWCSDRL